MTNVLKGKKIVLGITGSIAAYKACYLIRGLVKCGAEVQVVITPAGKEFITPITLSALTSKPVISDFFAQRDGTWHSHVDLGLWADAMLIAPATASTIGKMAHGIADNMLITTYLSMKAPVFVAPAMDLDMYAHPSTQANLDKLRSFGNHIIEPGTGELASHFPTYEKIDPVRFIGNYSSGKMGVALADECAARGANVILVNGPMQVAPHFPMYKRYEVESAAEMYDAATEAFAEADAAILAAAVADYTPEHVAVEKMKRIGDLALSLKPTQDIAARLGELKKLSSRKKILVGFALETTNELSNAEDKLARKNLDFIVLNSLNDAGAGFRYDTNKISIIDRQGKVDYPLKPKAEVAADIVDRLAALLSE